MEKYNEIQLTKNKMDLNNRKITDHPTSPYQLGLSSAFSIDGHFHFFFKFTLQLNCTKIPVRVRHFFSSIRM